MQKENLTRRVNELLKKTDVNEYSDFLLAELQASAISLLASVYGENSSQLSNFNKEIIVSRTNTTRSSAKYLLMQLVKANLQLIKSEIEMDLIGDLEKTISGEVLADFIALSRNQLEKKGDDAKNVAAVLAAASFEDTMRRLAIINKIPHYDKLADIITELKTAKIIQGSQVGIAQSYLNFRNNSLHAQWQNVDRPEIKSVLAFVEEIILKHFS